MDETWILLRGSGRQPDYGTVGINTMGLLNFNQPVLEDREVQGTYIYPDWVTCVKVRRLYDWRLVIFLFLFLRGRGKISFCKEDATAIL